MEGFVVMLHERSIETALASLLPAVCLYIDLCGSGRPRPSEVDGNDWIFELQRKKKAKWICSWGEQLDTADALLLSARA